jgi:hypothetical protein
MLRRRAEAEERIYDRQEIFPPAGKCERRV